MAANCIFCAIAAKEAPAEVVHESQAIMAFRDTNPKAPTHILLIPKEHVPSVRELTVEHGSMMIELLNVAAHLAKAEGVDESGWRVVANVGADAGQTVYHLHVHLLGGRRMGWPPG